jgi:beta-galactosidase
MMSERIYLNNDWKFAEQFEASMTEAAYDDNAECQASTYL